MIKVPIHLSGGNEKELLQIFKKIDPEDYVFSTHRNHYHYLLHTGDVRGLHDEILGKDSGVCSGRSGSMHTINVAKRFYSSGIVAGCVAIACGVSLALKMNKSTKKVWCFIGDGAADEGWFHEALTYARCNSLPITYILEDNNRSVCSSKVERWNSHIDYSINPHLIVYEYTPTWPHAGIGEFVPL